MAKRWQQFKPLSNEEESIEKSIREEFKCPDVISRLLVRRGLRSPEEISAFFSPSIDEVHDPFLLKGMSKSVDRIVRAIQAGEKITIYGDYDVDGTTSTALLYLGLIRVKGDVDYYVPHRMIDGYGLSLSGIEQLKDNGTDLIITVDCGVNAMEEVEETNRLGIDIIVTDHHNPKEELPEAYSIINPKLPGCPYPFKDLAGVGVAYKLLMAIYQKLGVNTKENINRFLDLVALGTIADIVPLREENRIFAGIGLKRLVKKKNVGINALIKIAGLSHKELGTSDIVYGIAPRINAAGRMGSAARAVELMVAKDPDKAVELANIIERENSLRQQIDQRTYQEACNIIDNKYKNMDETSLIVVSSDDWHQGVIGIVASKLVEKYYRPTIMVSCREGIGSGSGRSVADFDLFAALNKVEDLLESFGGHRYAAGFSILTEYLDRLENQLTKYTRDFLTKEMLTPPLMIDGELELYNINDNLIEWLEKFAPFGTSNARPTWVTREVTVEGYPYTVGLNHLKLKVVKDGCLLDLIGFNLGDYLPLLKKNSRIDIAYTLERNVWQNKATIQGKLKDIIISGNKVVER